MSKNGPQHSPEFLAYVYKNAAVGLCYIDTQLRYQHINEWLAALNGLPVEAHLGRAVREVLPDLADGIEKQLRQVIESGEPIIDGFTEAETPAHAGLRRTFSHNYHPVKAEDGTVVGVSCFVQDISGRKEAERQTAVAQSVLEVVADGVIVIDHRGQIQAFNPAAESIFGYRRDEVGGTKLSALMPEPYRSEHDSYISNYLDTGIAKIIGMGREVQGQRKDGSLFPMDLSVTEFRLDGAAMFVGLVRDMTERKQLMAQIVQAQKLDSVGQLAGGMAHDFNNQLGIMLLDVDMILTSQTRDSEAPPDLRDDLLKIRKGLVRSSALTKKILLFSQNVARKMEPVVVNGQIEEMGKMLSRLLGEHINSVVDLEEDLWSVSGDAVGIDQIVTNLAINSRDAMPDGGTLVIETRNVLLDPEVSRAKPRARPGRFVRIAIEDTGSGMDEDIQAQMYDPFFSTKHPNEHTGLGLSVVHGTVSGHGGWIDVESAPGRGTRFEVYLPALADETVSDSAQDSSPRVGESCGEHILLLEDETSLRDVIQKALERKGYAVESYADLATARPAISETSFDLLLCDVRLPDGEGTTLVAEALERDSSIATILMSGYVPTKDAPELSKFAKTAFLYKPFSLTDLLSEVRAQLDRPR